MYKRSASALVGVLVVRRSARMWSLADVSRPFATLTCGFFFGEITREHPSDYLDALVGFETGGEPVFVGGCRQIPGRLSRQDHRNHDTA